MPIERLIAWMQLSGAVCMFPVTVVISMAIIVLTVARLVFRENREEE